VVAAGRRKAESREEGGCIPVAVVGVPSLPVAAVGVPSLPVAAAGVPSLPVAAAEPGLLAAGFRLPVG
jgi:hypothetical protein